MSWWQPADPIEDWQYHVSDLGQEGGVEQNVSCSEISMNDGRVWLWRYNRSQATSRRTDCFIVSAIDWVWTPKFHEGPSQDSP